CLPIIISLIAPASMVRFVKDKALADNRAAIRVLWGQGNHNAKDIHRQTGVPYSTVKRQCAKLRDGLTNSPIKPTGRRTVVTPKKSAAITRLADKNMYLTSKKIRELVLQKFPGSNISALTVRRHLQKMGFKCGRTKKTVLMTTAHHIARLEWAKKYLHYDQWERVVWTDECSVQKYANGVLVWYREADGLPQ